MCDDWYDQPSPMSGSGSPLQHVEGDEPRPLGLRQALQRSNREPRKIVLTRKPLSIMQRIRNLK